MQQTEHLSGFVGFARAYIRDKSHHDDVRTEDLAEAFRAYFQLPPFPTLTNLQLLCRRLGVTLRALPAKVGSPDGLNFQFAENAPEIHIREDLNRRRAETTLCHEIREVLENAFRRENPAYVGLDTRDTKTMNPESDHFASCLLMQAEASRQLLTRNGFDLPSFSRKTGRSLPSVVLRLQSLFSIASREKHPHAGVWLFEAPWALAAKGKAGPADMSAKHQAYLCGFSTGKGKGREALSSRAYFPARGSEAASFDLARIAVEANEPVKMGDVIGYEMMKDAPGFWAYEFLIVAEPIPFRSAPWRLLVVAARADDAAVLDGWLQRLSARTVPFFEVNLFGGGSIGKARPRSPLPPSPSCGPPAPRHAEGRSSSRPGCCGRGTATRPPPSRRRRDAASPPSA